MRTGWRVRRAAKSIVLFLLVVVGLAVAAVYAGVEPFTTYAEVIGSGFARLSVEYGPVGDVEYPHATRFDGTYSTIIPLLSTEQLLTFKGDTLSIVDEFTGTSVFRYVATLQSEFEGELEMTEVASGKVSRIAFQSVDEADCLVLYSMGKDKAGVTYCRQ